MSAHKPLEDRFWSKVDKTDGCWNWTAGVASNGYGMIGVDAYHTKTAHRVSWIIHNGDIPNGLMVLHKCDNRLCVNPSHLYLGTVKDNSRDLWERGRPFAHIADYTKLDWVAKKRNAALPRGASHHRSAAKFDPETIIAVRNSTGSQKEIARRFGMCQQNVSKIKLLKTWSHINAPSDI